MDQIVVTDLRTISFDVPPQEILTKDSVTVTVDAVVYYKINNSLAARLQCGRIMPKVPSFWPQPLLGPFLARKTLSDLLADRENISKDIMEPLDEATDPWGIKVTWKQVFNFPLQ